MSLETLILPDPSPNMAKLSLLICHLFVGGNFRTLDILYHPDAINDQLLVGIDSACPFEMSKTTSDISLLELNTSGQNNRFDHFLQLIFLPLHQLDDFVGPIETHLTFYRVFVFSHTSETNQQIIGTKIMENTNSSSLLVIHNKINGTVEAYLYSADSNNFMNQVDLQMIHLFSETELFEMTLGDKALDRSLGVAHAEYSPTCQFQNEIEYLGLRMFGRLYFSRLNMSFLRQDSSICGNIAANRLINIVRPITRPSYNEFSLNYDQSVELDIQTKNNYTAVLHFGVVSKVIGLTDGEIHFPISSYKRTNIHAIFVYGTDFNNRSSPMDLFRLWKNRSFWVVLVIIFVSAAILYCIRRSANIRIADFMVAFLEVFTVVFGGGSIQCQHRWEKVFFAIGMGATFFLMSIYMADFSMQSVLLHGNQRIDNFQKLKNQNVSFYRPVSLTAHKTNINEMLSFTLKKHVTPEFKNIVNAVSTNRSFVYIVPDNEIDLYERTMDSYKLDHNMIKGILGSLNTNFHLKSKLHVPGQTIEKFNQLTCALMENGWFNFAEQYKDFKKNVKNHAETTTYQLSFELITLQEFYQPLVLYFCCMAGIFVIHLAEIIWHRIQLTFQR